MAFSFFFRSIVLGLVAFVCGVMGVQGQTPTIELLINGEEHNTLLQGRDNVELLISGIEFKNYDVIVNGSIIDFATEPTNTLGKKSLKNGKQAFVYEIRNIPNGDILKIDYNIIPKKDLAGSSMHAIAGSYEIPIKGGLKVDFSAGLAGTTLVDQSFYVKDSVPSNVDLKRGKIKENPKFAFDLGPAAFMHIYCRSGRMCNWGGNFGIMTNTDGKTRCLLGASLMFGIKTRFCLNTGIAMGSVKELREDYRQALGNVYTDVSSKDNLYIDRFKVGFYFGFSVSAFQSKSISLTPTKKVE